MSSKLAKSQLSVHEVGHHPVGLGDSPRESASGSKDEAFFLAPEMNMKLKSLPICSMYGIYANIGGILMVNVTTYIAYIYIYIYVLDLSPVQAGILWLNVNPGINEPWFIN